MVWLPTLIRACYFLAALLFILGLKRMSSPRTARGGIVWAGLRHAAGGAGHLFPAGHAQPSADCRAVVIGVGAAWWTGRGWR
jgi:NAD(P) transhydrogenase subunit beta